MSKTDPLLEPFQLKHLTIKNRIVSTPHAPAYAEDGMPKARYQLYHEEKAKGGIGMTMFGIVLCWGGQSVRVWPAECGDRRGHPLVPGVFRTYPSA